MRFKVGDVVQVRKGLIDGKIYGGALYLSKMKTSRPMTITRAESQLGSSGYYEVKENNHFWTDKMLEPANEPVKRSILIEIEERREANLCFYKVTAREGGKEANIKCWRDEFDLGEAAKKAIERMKNWPSNITECFALQGNIADLSIGRHIYSEGCELDRKRKEKNMLFRTREEAQDFLNKLNEFIEKNRKG